MELHKIDESKSIIQAVEDDEEKIEVHIIDVLKVNVSILENDDEVEPNFQEQQLEEDS